MFVILPAGLPQEEEPEWGPEQQESLSNLAAKFKKADDKTGLYLCALVEEQIHDAEKGGGCRCQAMLFLGMALAQGGGAGDALAHVLLPVVQDLISRARQAT